MKSGHRFYNVAGCVSIALFYTWVTFAPYGFSGAIYAAVLMLAIVLAIMSIRKRDGVVVSATNLRSDETSRILAMIIFGILIQILLGQILRRYDLFNVISSNIIYTVTWLSLPAVFVASKIISWPKCCGKARLAHSLLVALIAIPASAIFFCLGVFSYSPPDYEVGILERLTAILFVVSGALAEEIVFRTLLTTAIYNQTKSVVSALIFSSIAFALYHVPAVVAAPLIEGQLGLSSQYLLEYLPQMVWIIGFSLISGSVWLRTRSITLVVIVHAVSNLGAVLIGGLGAL